MNKKKELDQDKTQKETRKIDLELIKKAYQAQKFSYAPYSSFNVGAALLATDGTIYTGCNIENSAYTPTNCAERTAFFKGISEGEMRFSKIAIVGNHKAALEEDIDYCAPCGVCRQVMSEFCAPDEFQVIMARSEDDYKVYSLRELLPLAFEG